MKTLLLLILLSPFAMASGPKYRHKDKNVDDEVVQIYHDIRNVLMGDVRISSVTIGTATISNLTGTKTVSNACPGCVGEYVEGFASFTNSPASGVWGDLTSISLTAGDWDVSAVVDWSRNSATWSTIYTGISSTSGDSSTGLTLGKNWVAYDFTVAPTNVNEMPAVIPVFRVSISATTTYYLKFYTIRAANTPQAQGTLFARRVR